jgi:hypothetical protein
MLSAQLQAVKIIIRPSRKASNFTNREITKRLILMRKICINLHLKIPQSASSIQMKQIFQS